MRKQIKDFIATQAVEISKDYFIFQRVSAEEEPLTLKISFEHMAKAFEKVIEENLKLNKKTRFGPQIQVTGVLGETAVEETDDQLIVSHRFPYASIKIASDVHAISRIFFTHSPQSHSAWLSHYGQSYPDQDYRNKLVWSVGVDNDQNTTLMELSKTVFTRIVFIERNRLKIPSPYICDNNIKPSILLPEYTCCIKDAALILINDPSTELTIYSSMAGQSKVSLRHHGTMLEGFLVSGGIFDTLYRETVALELREVREDCRVTVLNHLRLEKESTEILQPLWVNYQVNTVSDKVDLGGQFNTYVNSPYNPLQIRGTFDLFYLEHIANNAWGARIGVNAVTDLDDHWITWMEADNTGSFRFLYGSGTDACDPVGWTGKLPEFIVQKLSGGGLVNADQYGNLFVTASDQNLKTNIKPLTCGLHQLLALVPVEFNWVENKYFELGDAIDFGLIAQDVERVIPELVKNLPEYKTVDYIKLIPILIAAIQELNHKITTLENHYVGTN